MLVGFYCLPMVHHQLEWLLQILRPWTILSNGHRALRFASVSNRQPKIRSPNYLPSIRTRTVLLQNMRFHDVKYRRKTLPDRGTVMVFRHTVMDLLQEWRIGARSPGFSCPQIQSLW